MHKSLMPATDGVTDSKSLRVVVDLHSNAHNAKLPKGIVSCHFVIVLVPLWHLIHLQQNEPFFLNPHLIYTIMGTTAKPIVPLLAILPHPAKVFPKSSMKPMPRNPATLRYGISSQVKVRRNQRYFEFM